MKSIKTERIRKKFNAEKHIEEKKVIPAKEKFKPEMLSMKRLKKNRMK